MGNSSGEHMDTVGHLSKELKFANVSLRPIQVLIYTELDSVLEVSKTQVLTLPIN